VPHVKKAAGEGRLAFQILKNHRPPLGSTGEQDWAGEIPALSFG
jgi:hypothetical protein